MCYLSDVFKQTLRHMWKYQIHWQNSALRYTLTILNSTTTINSTQAGRSLNFIYLQCIQRCRERDMNRQNIVCFWEKPDYVYSVRMTHTQSFSLSVALCPSVHSVFFFALFEHTHTLLFSSVSFAAVVWTLWIMKPCALQSILTV